GQRSAQHTKSAGGSKRLLSLSGGSRPCGHGRSGYGDGGGGECESVVSCDVEEPPAEKGADRAAKAAASLDHSEDRAQMWPREGIGRNRRELRDAHAEAETGRRIEQEERPIVRASQQGETADPDDRDNGAEREDRSAAKLVREPAAQEIPRHHAAGAEGEEPHDCGLPKAAIHRVGDLVSRHDLVPNHARHRAKRTISRDIAKIRGVRTSPPGFAGRKGARHGETYSGLRGTRCVAA